MCVIKCGNCGVGSPFWQWIERPSGEKLPDDQYECPICKVAVRRVIGPPRVIGQEGCLKMVIPGDITIEQITIPSSRSAGM